MQRVDDANLEGELRTDQYAALVVPELDNLRAAYAWASGEDGDPKLAIALAAHSGSLIDYAVECAEWLLPHLARVEADDIDESIAARYWRALSAGNMMGRVPLDLCVRAAERAHAMYRSLGKPRRMFSSLMRLVSYRQSLRQHTAALAALAEARTLIQPSWPTEFHIHMLRRESSLARGERRFGDAQALLRAEIKLSETTGDWRLQVIARNNLIDLLWQVGPIEQAAAEAQRLGEELRTRPAAISDTDVLYANLMGILSEMGRVDDASRAARDALPFMRRSHNYFLEEWIYLFWRRGQLEVAALLLGTLDAAAARIGMPLQSNERRLIATARKGIEGAMAPETLAQYRATGASIDADRLSGLLSEALAEPFSARS